MFERVAGVVAGLGLIASVASGQGVALIEIEGTPLERPDPLAWLIGSDSGMTLRQLTGAIEEAGERSDVDVVLLQLKDAALTTTQVEELASAIKNAQDNGKKVCVYAYSYATPGILLGSAADSTIVQTGGVVTFPGLFMEELFLGDTLRWIGLEPQLVQVGDYKGANEMFMNAEPSEAWSQNIDQLLDSMYANLREHVEKGRGLNDEQLDEAMRVAWMADAETAVDVGLIDGAVDLPDLGAHMMAMDDADGPVNWITGIGEDPGALALDPQDPMAMFKIFELIAEPQINTPDGPTIAVVHIDGPIVDGKSSGGGMMGGANVGSLTIRSALEDVRDNDDIKGVVVRINSPGGSAIASEVIWQGLRRVAEKKPVWASVGSMAASGGYYIAVGTDKIYVNDSSIVGSIGVVGGKMSPAGLMENLKINSVGRSRGPMADMFSTDAWTTEQVDLVRAKMTETYDLFVDRVRKGRPGIDPAKTAEGRLFTGDKAVGLKMADEIGGLDETVEALAGELGLRRYDVIDYPSPQSIGEMLEEVLGSLPFASAEGVTTHAAVAALQQAVGPQAWPAVRDTLEGLMMLRDEPVLLVLPRGIVVK